MVKTSGPRPPSSPWALGGFSLQTRILLFTVVGWHHRLSGHKFEETTGDGEGQGSLACAVQTRLSDRTTATGNSAQVGLGAGAGLFVAAGMLGTLRPWGVGFRFPPQSRDPRGPRDIGYPESQPPCHTPMCLLHSPLAGCTSGVQPAPSPRSPRMGLDVGPPEKFMAPRDLLSCGLHPHRADARLLLGRCPGVGQPHTLGCVPSATNPKFTRARQLPRLHFLQTQQITSFLWTKHKHA